MINFGTNSTKTPKISAEMERIAQALHHNPFSVLGPQKVDPHQQVIVYQPYCREMCFAHNKAPLARLGESDFFLWQGSSADLPIPYELQWQDEKGLTHRRYDPYSFPQLIADFDLHLFTEGRHKHIYRILGAHQQVVQGVPGVLFATWAPNAQRVSVIGDFNRWDGRIHPMRNRGASGVWELFIPGITMGDCYKFEFRHRDSGKVFQKADPYGQQFELRPANAAIVVNTHNFEWQDQSWMHQRANASWQTSPLTIYEVHLGSWQRDEHNRFLNYKELAHRMVSYCQDLGFNAIELLPVTEHPLDDSWGYQALGYFAPTSRFGLPEDFKYFINYCHQHSIAVLLDWVPGHFPKDDVGLAQFDGSALYEHEDTRRGEHKDWGTLIYNYGRAEVRNFLISSALFWLEEFHIDGLRVDAVASMLYLDYSRKHDEWLPNVHGGNENLEAIAFLQELNAITHADHPGTITIAEESTAWPQVTRPTWLGGLGFSMKWNMGWMHDTLQYMNKDPIHRHYHHDRLTFGLLYSFTENFVLPYSHDEVVHGKGSMLNKMSGDEWQRFANLRALYTLMFSYPGKKLLFMGNEFAQGLEWNFNRALEWHLLQYSLHQGMQRLIKDLNHHYRQERALHEHDFTTEGFSWIDCHDAAQSVISFQRNASNSESIIIIINFTPVPRYHYRIGVNQSGCYQEILNSDSEYYGGTNIGNNGVIHAESLPWMGRPCSISLTLPPLAGILLKNTTLKS